MTRITDDFMRNFEQSTVMPPADKDKTEEKAKAGGKGGLGASSSVTLEAPSQPSSGSGGSIPVALVPPPAMNPNEIMTQVQSLQSKLSTNQMSSSSHQLDTDHLKMNKAIKDYNDRIKKEHEQESKAHSKGLIGKIVDAVEDAVEVVAGVALCLIPGAQIAGAALLATAAISITDQVVTGAFGNKPLLTGKDAEIFNYCAMGASIVIGVATCGAGLLTSGAAVAADAAGDIGEGVEMTEMATQAAEDTTSTVTTAVKAGSTAEEATDLEDTVDVTEDVSETGDESEDEDVDETGDSDSESDTEQPQTRSTQNLAREQMEEAFEEGFEEDVADSGSSSGDGSGDGDSTGVPRRDLAIAGMKIGARMVKGVFGVVQAAGGITQGVNTIEIGKAMSQADQYEAEATQAQKDMNTATLDMKQTIGTLQNQIQQYEAINKDLTGVIMGYAQTQTDTAVQGYA